MSFKIITFLSCLGLTTFNSLSYASENILAIRFIESAPKDKFEIRNQSRCNLTNAMFSINLAPSAGNLIFDTTSAGLGVEVFQPLAFVKGAEYLLEVPMVKDGGQRIDLALSALPKGARIVFTIDIDDQQVNSALGQIRVTDTEIQGAVVTLVTSSSEQANTFTGNATAAISLMNCQD